MTTFYIESQQIDKETIHLMGDDVNHIKNVLRYQVGDEVFVCDERQERYACKIMEFEKDAIVLHIETVISESTETRIEIDLYQGFPKSDKLEWVIQKGTEIGIKKFIPIITDRVIVKLEEKNESKKIERWKKIAKEAAVQSGRQAIPIIENARKLQNIIENLAKYDIVIVPYECEKINTLKVALKSIDGEIKKVAIVIGPEGGFSDKDISILKELNNMQLVTLGNRILRTETAGIVTAANVIYELEE